MISFWLMGVIGKLPPGTRRQHLLIPKLVGAMQPRVTSPSASLPPAASGTSGRGVLEPPHHDSVRRFLALVDAHNPEASLATCDAPLPFEDDDCVVCVLLAMHKPAEEVSNVRQ